MKKKAVIIGGGLGGMAAALTLSPHFYVTIIDKNAQLGGKMQPIHIDGYHFDYGPNTLTMPHVFWQVVAPFTDAKALLPFEKIERPTCNERNGQRIVFSTDITFMKEQFAQICKESSANYEAFIAEITRLYTLSEQHFLNETFFYQKDYRKLSLITSTLAMHPHKTLAQFLQAYFPNDFICQTFMRFATYIGSSPYHTPATFALIAYFELVTGTYMLSGGASQIASTMQQLLEQQGVAIRCNETVKSLQTDKHRVTACTTDHATYEADIVISNMDVHLFAALLGRQRKKKELSTSAYIEVITLKEPVPLHHHNVLFSDDYAAEFTALRNGQYAQQPTVYSCYPYASDTTHKPALFVLINAPAYGQHEPMLGEQVSMALSQWGIEQSNILSRTALPASYIEDTFLALGGAIYGQASNSMIDSFMRPKNKDHQLDNLYYVGGTVHPGGGSPIVVNGGCQVAKRIIAEVYS